MKRSFRILTFICVVTLNTLFLGGYGSKVSAIEETSVAQTEEARAALQEILQSKTVMALVYLSDEYPVREAADYESLTLATVPSGQQVHIQDVILDDAGETWVYVSFDYRTNQYYGYLPRTHLACSDQDYLVWEEAYGMNPAKPTPMTFGILAAVTYPDIEAFPASYREALYALKAAHPNWTFVKLNTGLDWNSVITEQMKGGKSLVPDSYPAYMKLGGYGAGWSYSADNILRYYMDPRNALKEETIFQFELLTYNELYHTEAAVQGFLDNTFMKGIGPGTELTFAKIFWAIGREKNVSPFHLASRAYQEQGAGTSPLISGTYPGFEGFYNYFNIKASGKTNEEIFVNGLTYAKENEWKNAYFSILGGTNVISANYILKGQDTLYLQKYNVNPLGAYAVHTHQYMQNIVAPTSEGKNMRKLYQTAGSLENTFVFKIPVFEHMPDTASPYPTESLDVALTLPQGYSDPTIYLDGVPYPATVSNGKHVVTAPNADAKTAVMYQYNESGIPVGMYVWKLSYRQGAYLATPIPGLENLMSYHGFSIRITGKSGIRAMTGVSTEVRSALLSSGVEGYHLKEYGTLIMSDANRTSYPMIKGGEKVLDGMAYGYDASGKFSDVAFATVDGRYHYTSVLVGLPAEQYKTVFAFRGYMVLTLDGTDVVIYGPVMSRSIYALAEQLLTMGYYTEGSEADVFLRKIMTDADSITGS